MRNADKTRKKILEESAKLFASSGYEQFSIRKLAKEVGIAQSVIYHYFPDKDSLLKTMFRTVSKELGKKRHALPDTPTASAMLKQRIEFQLDHAQEVIAVLKFFFAYREIFPKIKSGYVPDKAYIHILEVLERGVKTGEFVSVDKRKDAKVIAHGINGFVMEYYPQQITGQEREGLVDQMHSFITRGLKHK